MIDASQACQTPPGLVGSGREQCTAHALSPPDGVRERLIRRCGLPSGPTRSSATRTKGLGRRCYAISLAPAAVPPGGQNENRKTLHECLRTYVVFTPTSTSHLRERRPAPAPKTVPCPKRPGDGGWQPMNVNRRRLVANREKLAAARQRPAAHRPTIRLRRAARGRQARARGVHYQQTRLLTDPFFGVHKNRPAQRRRAGSASPSTAGRGRPSNVYQRVNPSTGNRDFK